ncbi:MAG: sugar transporter [Candidatus Jettenia sp.]|nr:MAG: sugar transporter [Candidatus Jettenia sp. AMX1]MBC6928078.1 sugar transporter [Candidatus Jettenia sp.]NUN23362.1 polysaccharide biosynthesis/export family protein [Candidatus Jettenia caeni]MCE7879281.1 sugar transporter [Candidatus Jettenia sp. AMX1]MCQ3927493.1 sugar transporter [Candidatus Jettenia sp.]
MTLSWGVKKLKNIFISLLIFSSVFIVPAFNYADESTKQYTVGVDDVLEISVLGHDELKTVAHVASDGAISFPYVGVLYVKGMSLSEIEKELSKKLSGGYIKYAVVSVTLSSYKSMKFFVYGEVGSPGRFDLEDNITVLKAISAAGGITPDGLYGNIKLRRKQKNKPGYKEININLKNTKESHLHADMPIESEDIVIVERSNSFFVYGEVLKPGKFILEENTTVLKAISLSGGFAKYGSPDRVKILRTEQGKSGYKSIKVDMKGAVSGQIGKDILLEPEDIVIVLEGIL